MTDAQLPLLGPRGGLRPPAPARVKGTGEFAVVLVESPLPHLDRLFDYAIPAKFDATAHPGVRVTVRLAGSLHDGFILERKSTTNHTGRLLPLASVISPIPVLPSELATLCRSVADHYAGSLSDVVRLAVPPRVAGAETDTRVTPASIADAWRTAAVDSAAAAATATATDSDSRLTSAPESLGNGQERSQQSADLDIGLDAYSAWGPSGDSAAEYIDVLADAPRACWACPPGRTWEEPLAELLLAAAARGHRSLAIVPDAGDVGRLGQALVRLGGAPRVAMLQAKLGPRARYSQFLRVLNGEVDIVVGTRSAAFVPIPNLGLCVIWDDGDTSHAEQRAPYPHARDVLAIRCHEQKLGFLCGGYVRSPEVQRWVESSWMAPLPQAREEVRTSRPQISTNEDSDRSPFDTVSRLAPSAIHDLRTGLKSGPVLVQVARRGYVPATACLQCREIARCPACGGSIAIESHSAGSDFSGSNSSEANFSEADSPGGHSSQGHAIGCQRCDFAGERWVCPACGGNRLRAVVQGAGRVAHDLGRLFPEVPVRISTGDHPLTEVDDRPAVVVATSGLEPRAAGGYRAGFLPDAQLDLWRVGATARQEAFRRWLNAAALLAPGAPLRVAADPADAAVQALIRWDPAAFAAAELAERRELSLPPAVRLVSLMGHADDVQALLAGVSTTDGVSVLGPVPVGEEQSEVRAILTSGRGAELLKSVRHAVLARSAGHRGHPVRVQVDSTDLE